MSPHEEETQETPSDERPEEAPLEPLDVRHLLRITIAQLAAAAWQKMGLQPDPFTNTVVKDIEQARLAIDATTALVEKLLPHVRGQEARDYQSLLTDLRLNFVRQSGEQARQQ